MLRQLKPGRGYIICNVDEPYAEDVFEVIKHGQRQKVVTGEDFHGWPEGDIDYKTFIRQTWPDDHMIQSQAAAVRFIEGGREQYSLLADLRSQLAAANERAEQDLLAVKTLLTEAVKDRDIAEQANRKLQRECKRLRLVAEVAEWVHRELLTHNFRFVSERTREALADRLAALAPNPDAGCDGGEGE